MFDFGLYTQVSASGPHGPLVFNSSGHLVYRSGTVLAIFVGSHLGNIPMKFESHWLKGPGGVSS